MSTVLNAETGRTTGSANSRRLRREDLIPAVVYGHGMTPLPIEIARRELRLALSGPAGVNTVLDLTVDGTVYPAIVKDMQRHPVRRNVQHVDFLQINLNEEIVVQVPLRLEGEAKEVSVNGGLVDPAVDHIEVRTTPRNIPDEFVVDITDFTMESVMTLADLPMPDGVTATQEPDLAIVTVLLTRGGAADEAEAEAAEAGDEGEAPAADAAGEGDAPAADEAAE